MTARIGCWSAWSDAALDSRGRSMGIEYALGAAMVICLGWSAVIAALDLGDVAGSLGFVIVATALSWWVAPLSGMAVGVVCAFFADGFALSRDGAIDLGPSFLALVVVGSGVGLLAATAGTARRRRKDRIKAARRGVKDASGQTRTIA